MNPLCSLKRRTKTEDTNKLLTIYYQIKDNNDFKHVVLN